MSPPKCGRELLCPQGPCRGCLLWGWIFLGFLGQRVTESGSWFGEQSNCSLKRQLENSRCSDNSDTARTTTPVLTDQRFLIIWSYSCAQIILILSLKIRDRWYFGCVLTGKGLVWLSRQKTQDLDLGSCYLLAVWELNLSFVIFKNDSTDSYLDTWLTLII